MDIKILNIKYNMTQEDIYSENSKNRIFKMNGYAVDYYLNKYIKSNIEIPSNKELTIDEIKEKIKKIYKEVK